MKGLLMSLLDLIFIYVFVFSVAGFAALVGSIFIMRNGNG